MKGSIIFISYIFPPYNSIASQRSVKLLNIFLNLYETVYVVTLARKDIPIGKTDNYLPEHYLHNDRVVLVEVPLSSFGYEDPARASIFRRSFSGLLTRLLCSNGVFWLANLRKALKELSLHNNIDAIYVTGPPFLSFSTARNFGKKYRIPFCVDYRDLWTTNPRTPAFGFARKLIGIMLEKMVLRDARTIITVSDGCADSLRSFDTGKAHPVEVLMNLPDEAYTVLFRRQYRAKEQEGNKIKLVLTGTVYDVCTLWPILEAIRLIDEHSVKQFEFHYCGGSSALVRKDFEQYGMTHLLTDHGFVSKTAAIGMLGDADILISLVDDGTMPFDAAVAGLMTTKVFDYFLTGKPILNVGPPNTDINAFAKRIQYKNYFTFEASNSEGIRSFLANFIAAGAPSMKITAAENMPMFESYSGKLREILQ